MNDGVGVATFGAGCFWGVEAAFRAMEGVLDATVGYMGGHHENPGYADVCSGTTGHAEVVQVRYDPGRVSYEELLARFWEIHNPTTPDRQGPDVGEQYRSIIFTHDDDQYRRAEASRDRMDRLGKFSRSIVTRIRPATTFWPAEEYHQRYFEKRGHRSFYRLR